MFNGKKVIVVMPAYSAARTLQMTYNEVMEQGIVDLVILVDDASSDGTHDIAVQFPCTRVHFRLARMGIISSGLFPRVR